MFQRALYIHQIGDLVLLIYADVLLTSKLDYDRGCGWSQRQYDFQTFVYAFVIYEEHRDLDAKSKMFYIEDIKQQLLEDTLLGGTDIHLGITVLGAGSDMEHLC